MDFRVPVCHLLPCLLLWSIPAFAQESDPERVILLLQRTRFNAMVQGDFVALDSILSDDCLYIHSTGRVETKDEFVSGLKSGALKYDEIVTDSIVVRVSGSTVILNGIARMHVRSGEGKLALGLRFTEIYLRRATRWQMVSWQSTRIQ